jgi:hypothetical protein
MCELLVVRSPHAVDFGVVRPWAVALEHWGIAGFGWGVAWLAGSGGGPDRVRIVRGLGRFGDESPSQAELAAATSTQFLVHLRRPSRLSTIDPADTQPFGDRDHAWCHNGYLERAEEVRPSLIGRLRGRADSEVGWQWWLDRRHEGTPLDESLAAVGERFGGHVNLAFLGSDGALAIYGDNAANPFWTFRLGSAQLASTGLHSADESLFERIFPEATQRRQLRPGEVVRLDPAAGSPDDLSNGEGGSRRRPATPASGAVEEHRKEATCRGVG